MHDWHDLASNCVAVIFRNAEGRRVAAPSASRRKRKDCQTRMRQTAHDVSASSKGP
jgi:hypothetical protein